MNDGGGVTIDATGLAAPPILSGGTTVRQFALVGGSLTLRRLTLTTGGGNGPTGGNAAGGAVRNVGSTFFAYDCTFQNNSADESGGAFSNSGGTATATIERCTFTGNSTRSDNGTLDSAGAIVNAGTLTVRNCTFAGNNTWNTTTNGNSAAAILSIGPSLTLEHCTISGN